MQQTVTLNVYLVFLNIDSSFMIYSLQLLQCPTTLSFIMLYTACTVNIESVAPQYSSADMIHNWLTYAPAMCVVLNMATS